MKGSPLEPVCVDQRVCRKEEDTFGEMSPATKGTNFCTGLPTALDEPDSIGSSFFDFSLDFLSLCSIDFPLSL